MRRSRSAAIITREAVMDCWHLEMIWNSVSPVYRMRYWKGLRAKISKIRSELIYLELKNMMFYSHSSGVTFFLYHGTQRLYDYDELITMSWLVKPDIFKFLRRISMHFSMVATS